MKKDVLAIGLIISILGLVLWFIISPISREEVAVFGFSGFIIFFIGLAIVMYGCISKPKKVLPPPPPP